MAKFCGNCGAHVEDTARVCNQCGAPLSSSAPKNSQPAAVSPAVRAKQKKMLSAALGIAGVVIAAVLILLVLSQFTGYKGLLRKVMNAYENYEIETLVSASSNIYSQSSEDELSMLLGSMMSEQLASSYESLVGSHLDYFESEVGHNYKLSYEANEIYTMSKRNLEDFLDDLDDYMDVSSIKKIVVADLVVTATQGKKSEDLELEVIMSKEDGSWRLLQLTD